MHTPLCKEMHHFRNVEALGRAPQALFTVASPSWLFWVLPCWIVHNPRWHQGELGRKATRDIQPWRCCSTQAATTALKEGKFPGMHENSLWADLRYIQ